MNLLNEKYSVQIYDRRRKIITGKAEGSFSEVAEAIHRQYERNGYHRNRTKLGVNISGSIQCG